MAVEAERLLAVFEARFTSLEKALTKARNDSSKTFSSIEKDASKAENALATVGSKGVPGIDKATKAIGRTRFETANLASQFNDIGVQLAGGQSPFLIAIQQGSQINQVLGGTGAAGAVSMLGGAFASLINPVSLATIGLITAGGAAVQYFSSLMDNAGPTEASLKAQSDLIQRVAERWGDALPALKAYADELKLQQEEAERTAGVQATINQQFDEARRVLPDVRSALGGVVEGLVRTGAAQSDIDAVRNALNEADRAAQDFQGKLADGTNTTEDFERLSRALADVLANDSVAASRAATEAAIQLRDAYLEAAGASVELRRQENSTAAKGDRLGVGSMDQAQARFDYLRGFRQRMDPDAFEPIRSGGSAATKPTRDRAAEKAARERDAVQDLIESLQFERSLVGLTAVEKEKANALRRAGTAATDEEAQQIMTLVEATYTHREALKGQEEAYQQLQRAGETAINGLITAMADGKIEARELLSILLNVVNQMFSARAGGGGGGLLGMIFGGIPKFASGTNYAPGGMALVGEKGPELVNLPRGSQVIPNHRIGGGSVSAPVQVTIDARGADREGLSRVEQQVARLKAELPSTVVATVRQAQKTRQLR